MSGRAFAATDRPGSGDVVIVNKTFADYFWPGEDVVGRRIAWTGDVLRFIGVSGDWRTIVGVVSNTKDGGLDAAPKRVVFIPFQQADFPTGSLVIRTVNPAGLANAARAIIHSSAPEQPIENVLPLDAIRNESVGPRRLNALLVGSFGLLALVIAAIGIAAVLAFSVSARTNEIGVRMSLGAAPGQVLRMILSEGGLLVALGLLIGLAGSVSIARLMQGLLFGVTPTDPATLAAVAVGMAAIGVMACLVPASRAARIDPSEALRAR
jgi:putative ABC transport system permease protein